MCVGTHPPHPTPAKDLVKMQILLQQVGLAFLPCGKNCWFTDHRWSQPHGTVFLTVPAVSTEQVVRCHVIKWELEAPLQFLVPAFLWASLHWLFCRASLVQKLWKQPLGSWAPAASVPSRAPPWCIVSSPTSPYHLGMFSGDRDLPGWLERTEDLWQLSVRKTDRYFPSMEKQWNQSLRCYHISLGLQRKRLLYHCFIRKMPRGSRRGLGGGPTLSTGRGPSSSS